MTSTVNFKSLLTANDTTISPNDTNPVLVMYFSPPATTGATLFGSAISIGRLSSLNQTTMVKPSSITTTTWLAKLYTYITPSTTGNYLFKVEVDDWARLYLNNTLILEASYSTTTPTVTAATSVNLNPANGPYLLYIEYKDTGGQNKLIVSYTVGTSTTSTNLTDILTAGKSPTDVTGLTANKLYMSKFNPYTIATDGRRIQSTNYCTTGNKFATDTNCLGTQSNGYDGINKRYTQTDPNTNYQTAIIDYCRTDNRFATDTAFCDNANYRGYTVNTTTSNDNLNNAIGYSCNSTDSNIPAGTNVINNNLYPNNSSTSFCRTKDMEPSATMNSTYKTTIRNKRLQYMQKAIDNALATETNKGVISKEVYDYITEDYPRISSGNPTSYPNNILIRPGLTQYCEYNLDARTPSDNNHTITSYTRNTITFSSNSPSSILDYKRYIIEFTSGRFKGIRKVITAYNTNNKTATLDSDLYTVAVGMDNSTQTASPAFTTSLYEPLTTDLCNAIYTTYPTISAIQTSQQKREDFRLGIQTNAFMGVSDNTDMNTKYRTERDSPEKFAIYLPYAINYCNTNNNIVTEPCQTYYNNIESNINTGLTRSYTNASTVVSPFANKEELCNNEDYNEYNNETYNKEYNETYNENYNENNNMLYLVLFIFIMLVTILMGSCANKARYNYSYNKKRLDNYY